ncbi:MAG: family 16 glycoside hydrolase, partial [Planctomycetaceae bacterium]|nr:family 16 glycoside hydrolase [Planctomycetaceae bacterium]
HNGVVVQNNVALENKTGGGRPEGPEPLPILFQNHGNPVEFRNVWLVDLTTSTACPMVYCHAETSSRRMTLKRCR